MDCTGAVPREGNFLTGFEEITVMGVTEMQGKQSRLSFLSHEMLLTLQILNSQKCTSFKKLTYGSVLGDCFWSCPRFRLLITCRWDIQSLILMSFMRFANQWFVYLTVYFLFTFLELWLYDTFLFMMTVRLDLEKLNFNFSIRFSKLFLSKCYFSMLLFKLNKVYTWPLASLYRSN